MQALKVTVVPVTPFAQNCSIVACTATDLAAVVDPGGDLSRIMEAIAQLGVTPERILLTHGHIDHAGAAADLVNAGADRRLDIFTPLRPRKPLPIAPTRNH